MQRFAKPSVAKAAHRFDPYTHRQIYGGSYVAYLSVLKTVKSVKRRRGSTPLASAKIGLWCNGSTRDFDSLSRGSNPCRSAKW